MAPFVIFFLVVGFINWGKFFSLWDEFCFWGLFIKDTLRLDALYCTSELKYFHQDYMPTITIFEALWCRLSLGFYEADVFRAIQILQFSMVLPLFERTKKMGECLIKACLLILLPVAVVSLPAYHTICQDVIFGFLIFYCIFVTNSESGTYRYKTFLISLSLGMLITAKMTAVFFLPLIIAYAFFLSILKINNLRVRDFVIATAYPLMLWIGLYIYIRNHVNTGGEQSYAGSVRIFFTRFIQGEGIPWQNDVKRAYIDALFKTRPVFGMFPYAFTIAFFAALIILMALLQKGVTKKQTFLISTWIVVSGTAYAVLMYILYCTTFSEYEAVRLASYERYMESFVLAAALLLTAVFFQCYGGLNSLTGIVTAGFLVFQIIIHPEGLRQFIPGVFCGEPKEFADRMKNVSAILEKTPADSNTNIYILACGDNGGSRIKIRYDVYPRHLSGGSIGLPRYDGDIWSIECTKDELLNIFDECDYLYFAAVDDIFLKEYGDVFSNREAIIDGNLVSIAIEEGKVLCTQM